MVGIAQPGFPGGLVGRVTERWKTSPATTDPRPPMAPVLCTLEDLRYDPGSPA